MTTDSRTSRTRVRWSDLPAGFIAALVVGALGWFISFSDSYLASENGRVTGCWRYDYAMIVLGAGSVLLAVAGVVRSRRSRHPVPIILVALITLAVLINGILLMLRGLDVFPDVCGPLLDGTAELPG